MKREDKRWDLKPNKIQSVMLGIIVAGLFFLFVAEFFGSYLTVEIKTILFHLSSSLLILGIVIFAFEVYLRNDSLDKVERIFSEQISSLNKKIDTYVVNRDTLLKMASENGIEEIFSQRSEANNRMIESFKKINDDKHLPLIIDLLGISLKDFVRQDSKLSESFNAAIESLDDHATAKKWSMKPGPLRTETQEGAKYDALIRIMVLYPYSKTAVLRICREEASYGIICSKDKGKNEETITATRLYSDVKNTLQHFYEYFKTHPTLPKNVKVEVRLCTFNPMVYAVRINNQIFQESYHLGKIDGDRYIGGKSLILLYNSGMQFNILTNHFNHLWDHPTTIKFEDAINPPDTVNQKPLDIKKPKDLKKEYQEAIIKFSI
jgi:hypothetical protein